MIEAFLNLLLHCHHRHLSRLVCPIRKRGVSQGECYVVCLDCGQQFTYDSQQLRMGKAIIAADRASAARRGCRGPASVVRQSC
jgi:hypothetical protein